MCRITASQWGTDAFDLLDELARGSFTGLCLHVDILKPGFASAAGIPANMIQEMKDVCIDGLFGMGSTLPGMAAREDITQISAAMGIAMLASDTTEPNAQPSPEIVSDWEHWHRFPTTGQWQCRSIAWYPPPRKEGGFIMSRLSKCPMQWTPDLMLTDEAVLVSKDGASRVLSAIFANALPDGPNCSSPLLFYFFNLQTKPWELKTRLLLDNILSMLKGPGDKQLFGKEEKGHNNVWTIKPISSRFGDVHISLKRASPNASQILAWHSTLTLHITIDTIDTAAKPLYIGAVVSW
jgi:hypothetical protein